MKRHPTYMFSCAVSIKIGMIDVFLTSDWVFNKVAVLVSVSIIHKFNQRGAP